MGAEAGVKKLILTHTGKRMTAPGLKEKAIAEVAAHFPGEVIFGEELMVLDLG
jgi:ribonuclease BN (tRNA processing enzyme)